VLNFIKKCLIKPFQIQGVAVFEEGQFESVIEMPIPENPNVSSPVDEMELVLEQPEGRAKLDNHLRGCSFKVLNDIGMGLIEFKRQRYVSVGFKICKV
jgi:hypothetical protein